MSQGAESKFASFLTARKETAVDKPTGAEREPSLAPPPRGKCKGKRRDPAFEQVTAYIRRDTHHAVKIALLKESRNRQFSELVEALLADWLTTATQTSELPPI